MKMKTKNYLVKMKRNAEQRLGEAQKDLITWKDSPDLMKKINVKIFENKRRIENLEKKIEDNKEFITIDQKISDEDMNRIQKQLQEENPERCREIDECFKDFEKEIG